MDDLKKIIESRELKTVDFLRIYSESMKKNQYIQFVFFSSSYFLYYPKTFFDFNQLNELIEINSNGRWIQLFDDNYVGFGKNNVEYFEIYKNKELSHHELNVAKTNYQEFKFILMDNFYSKEGNLDFFNRISQFEELDYSIKESTISRSILYSKENTEVTFKPLHIKNWLLFYDKIINHYFHDFKTIKNTKDIILFEKAIAEESSVQIEIDKKRLELEFKVDNIILPSLKVSLVVNKESHRLFYYVPYINGSICKSNEEVEYIKKYTFFILNIYLEIHAKIINLIIK